MNENDETTFEELCMDGDVDGVREWHEVYGIDDVTDDLFMEICKNGDVELAEWLHDDHYTIECFEDLVGLHPKTDEWLATLK